MLTPDDINTIRGLIGLRAGEQSLIGQFASQQPVGHSTIRQGLLEKAADGVGAKIPDIASAVAHAVAAALSAGGDGGVYTQEINTTYGGARVLLYECGLHPGGFHHPLTNELMPLRETKLDQILALLQHTAAPDLSHGGLVEVPKEVTP